jgi:hypothetical protein
MDWNVDEIKELSDAASFTITDMATWCGSGKSAMREWMTNGVTPHPIKQKYLKSRLDLIRWALKHTTKLPVPIDTKQQDRTTYVQQVRDYALGEFSKAGASKRGD